MSRTMLTTGIATRIAIGYVIVVLVALLLSLLSYFTIRELRRVDRGISEDLLPTYIACKELGDLNRELFDLCNKWIYQPSVPDKEGLRMLIESEWPELRKKLEVSVSRDGREGLASTLADFESATVRASEMMKLLHVDSLYSNDANVDQAIDILDNKIQPATSGLSKKIDDLLAQQHAAISLSSEIKAGSYRWLNWLVILSAFIYAIVGVVSFRISRRGIVRPINSLKGVIISLSRGEIVDVRMNSSNDELGEIIDAIKAMVSRLKANCDFAFEIGKGNYTSRFELLGEKDQMGRALINMRENLKGHAEQSERRNWSTSGMASMAELLRKMDFQSTEAYDPIIQFLVKYLRCNQGAIYILDDEFDSERCLKLVSCYAYDRKKFIGKRIAAGEGLAGQCLAEGERLYLLEVPRDFVRITSGLGEASPRCVLIVPIKSNQNVLGVIEVASFQKLSLHEIEFLEKIGESLAITITQMKASARTSLMFNELQEQSEQMRAQEEEMRQNVEELSAIQEEMTRKEREYINRISELEAQLSECTIPSVNYC